ncbi:ABC-type transport system involved in multi-copper enzyme maturation permease subunit [Micromonospora pisi]|uniref:ABC-type transport system involved in multi-copper enzyme maturation permease subunit n=1 Tax=Micromonospora pisi TaxID=589240 RepID=A0A495JJX0_9ACTN|nr:ABC transporter permease subunit [Micromonospora pisi]RKR88878.1 ABC-type transport system involved in multi-copper enzyme maturation permease subunit [Micromonospora pisi]
MNLYTTELRRIFKRRLTRIMLVLLVLGLGGIAVAFTVNSHKVGPAQVAAAEARAEAEYQQQVKYHEESVRGCEAAKAVGAGTDRYPPDCGREWAPTRENFQAEWFMPYQFDFRAEFGVFISIFAGILALFGFVVGASYIGAEWHSGGMTNLLLWRPKRLTVLFTKLGALLTTLLGLSLVLGALWTAAFWLIGRFDGVTGKLTQGVWQSFALSGLRAVGLVLAVGAIAFGLASLGRHTAMALGVAVGVAVVSEIGIRTVMAIIGTPFGDRYVLSSYALAWFEKEWKLFDYNACNFQQGECTPGELVLTWQDSGLVFGVGTAIVLAAAIWAMRSRDVT